MDIRTRLQHPVKTPVEGNNQPIVSPIYQSVKFKAPNVQFVRELFSGEKNGYFYSRISNPTVQELEVLLAGLQQRNDGICVGSGMCAITTTLLALLEHGDHIIVFRESYKPTRITANTLLKKFGIEHTLLSIGDFGLLESTLKAKPTKLIIFESPTNPCLFIADIERLTSLAKKYGALTVMDNTFAGFHNHGSTAVDVFVHSLTKFACGHSDAMGGIIITNNELAKKIRFYAIHIGGLLDPNSAFLTLRGMKTYAQRYRIQSESALIVADGLEKSPGLTNVRYPGLKSHPQYELAAKQLKDFGSVISFDLPESGPTIDEFIDNLQLFHLAASIGSTESLVAPVLLFFSGDLSEEDNRRAMMTDRTIRLSIGLEAPEDLLACLKKAINGTPKKSRV